MRKLTECVITKLNEDFWNPRKYFLILQDMDDTEGSAWNEATQEERDAMVRPYLQRFWDQYGQEMTRQDLDDLFEDMEDSNWHTPLKVLIDIINKSRMNEAFNPDNAEKNKIISNALKGPKSLEKNKEELKKMGIKYSANTEGRYDNKNNRTVILSNPKTDRAIYARNDSEYDKDGYVKGTGRPRQVRLTGGSFKKDGRHWVIPDRGDYTKEEADKKQIDYYNYLNKPFNMYQAQVNDADEIKRTTKRGIEWNRNDAKKYYPNNPRALDKFAKEADKDEFNARYNYFPDESINSRGLRPEEENLNRRVRKYLSLKPEKEEAQEEYEDKKSDVAWERQNVSDAKRTLRSAEKEKDKSKQRLNTVNKEIKKLHNKNFKESVENPAVMEDRRNIFNKINTNEDIYKLKIEGTSNTIELYIAKDELVQIKDLLTK